MLIYRFSQPKPGKQSPKFQNQNLKITNIVDTVVSKSLRDFYFNWNQELKSTDD